MLGQRSLRIVLMASEVVPYVKTGGLADVVGALARTLARRGHEVHVVLPLYASIDRARWNVRPVGLQVGARLGHGVEPFEVHEALGGGDGRPFVWMLHHAYFERPDLYGERGGEYEDNHLRFGAFCRAALEFVRRRIPRPDVVHLHDWQTGLAAVDLRAGALQNDPAFAGTQIVFTIHNLAYMGSCAPEALDELGLGRELFRPDALEFYGRVALIKGGLVYADWLTTVSPRYAQEIQTVPFGSGFDGLLRARSSRLAGILNGIDTEEWDPTRDRHLPVRYAEHDLSGKYACKQALQSELGLHQEGRAPLFGVVSRLAWQKGIDLVAELAESVVHRGGQLAVLGTGEPGLEQWLNDLAFRFPGRIAVRNAFDEGLAHRIVAGSDSFLMPSRYEPCGLTQMYALRYGAPPVVRAVGGLDDTVDELDSARDAGNGFKFGAATASAFWAAIQRALGAWHQPGVWTALAQRGMKGDFSWDASAAAYEALYQSGGGAQAGAHPSHEAPAPL